MTVVPAVVPVIKGIDGTIHEGFNSNLTITGAGFERGCVVTIEGAAVGTNVKVLVADLKSSAVVVALTAAATIPYKPMARFNVRVTNPIGLSGGSVL